MTSYRSRSTAVWAYGLALSLIAAGLGLGLALGLAGHEAALAGPLLVIVGLVLSLFASLTVEVDAHELRWRFGPGPLARRVPLDRIRAVEATRSPWYWGWGIRWTPRGWLWRAHGLDTVWFELDDGRRFGVGTQDPAGLVRAIERRR